MITTRKPWIQAISVLSLVLSFHAERAIADAATSTAFEELTKTLNSLKTEAQPASNPCPPVEQGPGCSNLMESFCSDLYSQKNRGNLDIQLPDRIQQLRFGDTPSGLSYKFALLEKAKFDSRARLPQDLQRVLSRSQYFEKMQSYLQTKPIPKMNLSERKSFDRLNTEIGQLWNSAVEEVMLDRMESKHPGYSKLTEFPPRLAAEFNQEQNELYAAIYSAIWSEHPLWKQVEADFKTVKSEYIKMLGESQSLDPALKKEWIERIQNTRLVAPGTDPNSIDHECATTEENAYNVSTQGYITVCAGYFTSENTMSTLAHELSHSLGVSRAQVLFERNSELGKRLYAVHQSVCKNTSAPQCPKDWSSLKKDLPKLIESLKYPDLPKKEYLSCLQYHKVFEAIPPEYPTKQGKYNAVTQVSALADKHVFLNLTEKQLPLEDGSKHSNPSYLNPCAEGFQNMNDWQLTGSLNLQFLFTEEYLCSDASLSETQRMRNAIDAAQEIQQQIEGKMVTFGGTLSGLQVMSVAGYAEDSEERFADSMGYSVFSRILKKTASTEQRRNLFFAATAKFCSKPSIEEQFPDKTQVEKEYSLEPHSSGKKRRTEVLTAPIRAALGCSKDFEGKDCSL